MINKAILITTFALLLISCGVIPDASKIANTTWTAKKTYYYEYNKITDSYIKHKGVSYSSAADQTSDNPFVFGSFFGQADLIEANFYFKFQNDEGDLVGDFIINGTPYGSTISSTIIPDSNTSCKVNTYNSSLEMKITKSSSNPIWGEKFNFSTSWPLTSENTMEIFIDAEDMGKSNIKVPTRHGTRKVKAMKVILESE